MILFFHHHSSDREKQVGESTSTKMDRRVDELIKQNVLLQNDLSRVNADIVQIKMQADEKVKEVYERLRVNQLQYEAIVTGILTEYASSYF